MWKPAQTELLWDSLLRGFPIGAFVLCPKLKGQKTRDEDERRVSHHLLDGQQRAHAIALGFQDPFKESQAPNLSVKESQKEPILWLDLKPDLKGTRSFLVRLTTQAHPWGYAADDAASPLGIAKIRKSLEACGCWDLQHNNALRRPSPRECWPNDAEVPVPIAWLVKAYEETRGTDDFSEKIKKECEALLEKCNAGPGSAGKLDWAKGAVDFLRPSNPPNLEHIREAIERALQAHIVWLELKKEVLDALSPQEVRDGQEDGGENIANVEHLFQRLNAGGTRLEGDELAYSMIKAYWPGIEAHIKDIADRRMPEARLFTLAARSALSPTKIGEEGKYRQILHGPVPVSDIRQFGAILKETGQENEERKEKNSAYKERKENAKKIRDFIFASEKNLDNVLVRIENWLGKKNTEDQDDIGLPPVLKTSIARGSPEVWLLLMWLAKRTLEESHDGISGSEMRMRVLGLATASHWFGYDKGRAVQEIAKELHGKRIEPELFKGILAKVYTLENNRIIGLYRPLSPAELGEMIVVPEEPNALKDWKWDGQIHDENARRMKWPFLQRVKDNREILLYAQRRYIKREPKFKDYDPSRADMWDQHNRPWDFDHIFAKASINYQNPPNQNAVKQWIFSLANLRACPMEENRSANKDIPTKKLNSNNLADSFVTDGELEDFNKGAEHIYDPDKTLAFVNAAKARPIRIYRAWYDTLEIGGLAP